MKKLFFAVVFIGSATICSNVYAQLAPSGGSDKNLGDNDVKTRSVELERTKRDAKKNGKTAAQPAAAPPQAEDRLAAKYDEIKTDYEQIQLAQDAIVKTYQGKGKIDFAQIGKSALEINRGALRLLSNLFPTPIETAAAKKEIDKTEKVKPTKSLRDLIVELDDRVGSFAASPMFQNLRTVDAQISEEARLDLEQIIELSALLEAEAQKSANEK